jgi:hypothetical protein
MKTVEMKNSAEEEASMKNKGNYLSKVIFFSMIVLAGYIGCTSHTCVVTGSSTDGIKENVETVSGSKVSSYTSQGISALYPVCIQKYGTMKYGYIDSTGKMVIQPIYEDAQNFSEGFAIVYTGKEYHVIDEKGKEIVASIGPIQTFHDGLAAFSDSKNSTQGYINTSGSIIIRPQFDTAGSFRADGTAIVTKSGKYEIINKKGKILKTYRLHKKYTGCNVTDDGYVMYTDLNTHREGVLTIDGKVILKPVYEEVTYLGDGLFGVKKALSAKEAYLVNIKPAAIVNKYGKRITSYKYYDLSEFNGDYATATSEKYTYFIEKSGRRAENLPLLEGRGTAKVLGNVIQADIDNEMFYIKKDGTTVWKNDGITRLSSGIKVSTVKFKPNKYVVVNYPQIDGMENEKVQNVVNTKLKTIFTKSRMSIKEKEHMTVHDNFTVKQIRNLLIINATGYDYYFGCAHGTPICIYHFIDTKTGDFYQLKDLFHSNSDYVTKLSKIIAAQMKEKSKSQCGYNFTRKDKINKEQYFYLSEDKLTIYFDTGTVMAYAAGFPKFEIPFQDIMDMIDTNGSFWKAFHE